MLARRNFPDIRVHVLIHAAALFSQGTDPKAHAMGYSHSYLDPESMQLKCLATFPTDDEIEAAAAEAWEESIALLDLLGIHHADITGHRPTARSSIGNPAPDLSNPDESSDEGDEQTETDAGTLRYLIDIQRSPGWNAVDEGTQSRLHTLTCAAIALDIGDQEEL